MAVELALHQLELLLLLVFIHQHHRKLARHKFQTRSLWLVVVLDPVTLLLTHDPELILRTVDGLLQFKCQEHILLVLHVRANI